MLWWALPLKTGTEVLKNILRKGDLMLSKENGNFILHEILVKKLITLSLNMVSMT